MTKNEDDSLNVTLDRLLENRIENEYLPQPTSVRQIVADEMRPHISQQKVARAHTGCIVPGLCHLEQPLTSPLLNGLRIGARKNG